VLPNTRLTPNPTLRVLSYKKKSISRIAKHFHVFNCEQSSVGIKIDMLVKYELSIKMKPNYCYVIFGVNIEPPINKRSSRGELKFP